MITSLANAAVKRIVLLQAKDKARRDEGLFIVEGVRMYMEVPTDRLDQVYVTEEFLDKTSAEVRDRLSVTGYELVTDEVMKKMSDTVTPQGVLCTVQTLNYKLDDIVSPDGLYIILDGLQDPGNLGTIFRTAEAAGVSGIICSKQTVSIYNPKSVRSTMGTLFRMPFIYVEDLIDTIHSMQADGVQVYAAHLDQSESYDKYNYETATAFVIGNEGAGISREVADASSHYLHIPMEGSVESLNAAIAASILLYEAHRQRA